MTHTRTLLMVIAASAASFGIGFYASNVMMIPTKEELREAMEKRLVQLHYDTQFLTDVKTVKGYTNLLYQIRAGKLTEKEIWVLEALLWSKLETVELVYEKEFGPEQWSQEIKDSISYAKSYRDKYIKTDPNKLLQPTP